MTNEEREALLKPRMTDEFLSTLVELAKTVGWLLDYVEVEAFVRNAFDFADKKLPDMTPYEDDD
ncbi:MAG: hypothetical protein PHI12_07430 [Dehalococcoidales bacterium]|nr:hypothetical protein [Dehalococcoidales bacterium]